MAFCNFNYFEREPGLPRFISHAYEYYFPEHLSVFIHCYCFVQLLQTGSNRKAII